MKIFIALFCTVLISAFVLSQEQPTVQSFVEIQTEYGNLKIRLYDSTFLHRDNFLKLIREGFYEGQSFHRLIKGFMIQGGDPHYKDGLSGDLPNQNEPGYTIPAEIFPFYIHKKGALAAARMGNDVNPRRASSASQFYIVQGKVFTDVQLDQMVSRGVHKPFTSQERKIYTETGGAPHLDGEYTVFGELTGGFEVFERLMSIPTDENDHPSIPIKYSIKILNNND